jgi:hypothetical protein
MRLEVEGNLAPGRDGRRVGDGPGVVGEIGRHFPRGLEIELIRIESQSTGIAHRLAGLDAQQHFVGAHVGRVEIVAVVGGHQPDGEPLAHLLEHGVDPRLFRNTVVLDLEKKIILAEKTAVGADRFLGQVDAAVENVTRDLTVKTSRETDQPLAVFLQQRLVDARFVIEALQLGHGGQLAQVAVAPVVPGQQHQMGHPLGIQRGFVRQASGSHIAFAPDDRLDTCRGRLLVELHRSEHRSVVGDGHRRHAELACPLHQRVKADGAIQQTVLGVQMKMNEI